MGNYEFTNYCRKCWEKKLDEDRIEEQKRQEEYRKKKMKRDDLVKSLGGLEYEPIPIKHAIIKYREQIKIANTINWIKREIINAFKDILKVKKIKNRWYCCKNRLDSINFKLFYFH